MDFTEDIKEAKPNVTASTCKTYNSLLRSIYKGVFGESPEPNVKKFDTDSEQVMEFLDKKAYNTRKTYLAALVCIAPKVQEYKQKMLSDINEHNTEMKKSEMTTKLENSAISKEEIDAVLESLKHTAEVLFKRRNLRVADLMEIQNYVILSLYYGWVVPRRALDYTEMKRKDFDPAVDNYIDFKRSKMIFNRFKTAKWKGQQELPLPTGLKKILQKWNSLIPDAVDSLFFNSNLEPLTSVSLNHRLNAIFGGKKSVNALRHFYLTSKYKDLMKLNEQMSEDMNDMGSSEKQANVYIKTNDSTKK